MYTDSMASRAPVRAKLDFDQFVAAYSGREGRYELIDGEAWMMAGGTKRHAIVSGRILARLTTKLPRGCVPVGSDGWLKLDRANARLPDVAVYCDPRDLGNLDSSDFNYPCVIFEVLSESTAASDRRNKVPEYKAIQSVSTIVLVDTGARTFEVFERVDDTEWRNTLVADGAPLSLAHPPLTLTVAEVFDL